MTATYEVFLGYGDTINVDSEQEAINMLYEAGLEYADVSPDGYTYYFNESGDPERLSADGAYDAQYRVVEA